MKWVGFPLSRVIMLFEHPRQVWARPFKSSVSSLTSKRGVYEGLTLSSSHLRLWKTGVESSNVLLRPLLFKHIMRARMIGRSSVNIFSNPVWRRQNNLGRCSSQRTIWPLGMRETKSSSEELTGIHVFLTKVMSSRTSNRRDIRRSCASTPSGSSY